MMTQERVNVLSEILTSDQERAKNLLALEPNDALAQINNLGYDFTLDEINEYGKALKTAVVQGGELDVEALDTVAGGIAPIVIAVGIAVATGTVAGGIARTGVW